MLSEEKIKKYQKKLEEEKARLLEEMKKGEAEEDYGNDVDHFEEETDEAEETAIQGGIDYGLKKRISKIDLALDDIAEKRYGICKKCGMEISEKVLDIAPESRLCQRCKAEEK
jgi:RNA polymerase-binding transcription factor DksA